MALVSSGEIQVDRTSAPASPSSQYDYLQISKANRFFELLKCYLIDLLHFPSDSCQGVQKVKK